ncbi:MAG TPA: hypothetical protein VFV86_07845, partial [Nitrososphaeraceae archaeon]|nr:hypothetical protein [Nitrososphaeraceae archaeon]
MKKREEFTFTIIISLMLFVLVSISVNFFPSIKASALNEDLSSNLYSSSYSNETINIVNNSMMLPGDNMTFVSSLDN